MRLRAGICVSHFFQPPDLTHRLLTTIVREEKKRTSTTAQERIYDSNNIGSSNHNASGTDA
jgi:hypothetical protein